MQKTFLFALVLICSLSWGQKTSIRVYDSKEKEPIAGAVIHFLGKHYFTSVEGNVYISEQKKGQYPIKITQMGYSTLETVVSFPAKEFVFYLREEVNQLQEVVVEAEAKRAGANTVAEVASQRDISQSVGSSLAQVVERVKGARMLQTGSTISKPIIHGMHSNRVLILNNEVRQEGQQWSPDHAPEIDPQMAQKIVVVKGASAVRYGSDALAGVILMQPSPLPYGDSIHGELSTKFSTNALGSATNLRVESSVPKLPQLAFRVQGSMKRFSDTKTAQYALNNTSVDEKNFSFGGGYSKNGTKIEGFYSRFDNASGVFYGSHIGNLDDLLARFELGRPISTTNPSFAINSPKQKVIHNLAKAKATWKKDNWQMSLQYSFQDNKRQEFSLRRMDRGKIPSLNMKIKTHSLDLEVKKNIGQFLAETGANLFTQNNLNDPNTGVVPVIPNHASFNLGGFVVGKYAKNVWSAEAGIRYDYKYLSADGYNFYGKRYSGEHQWRNISYSIGGGWKVNRSLDVVSNIGVAWRAPQVSELYSNGIHHGAGTFDIGNENLQSERGLKWVGSAIYKNDFVEASAEAFLQRVKNYIYDFPTKDTKTLFTGVYPIFAYGQSNAIFKGFDAEVALNLCKEVKYAVQYSRVDAKEEKTGKYYPFIPPQRIENRIEWNPKKPWGDLTGVRFAVKHKFTDKQRRFDPEAELVGDTPEGYHLIGAEFAGQVPIRGLKNLEFSISGENLANCLYKDYTNRFRYYAHDKGRTISLAIKLTF